MTTRKTKTSKAGRVQRSVWRAVWNSGVEAATKSPAKGTAQAPAPDYVMGKIECDYRPWWQGQRRSRRRATAFDTYAAAALTGLLVREGPETTLSELVEGALHLATLMEQAKEERGKWELS